VRVAGDRGVFPLDQNAKRQKKAEVNKNV